MEALRLNEGLQPFAEEDGPGIRPPRKRMGMIFLGALLLLWMGLEISPAQTVSHEYEIKAVFLFNFAKFTTWPTNAFPAADSQFVIGVIGDDPFNGALEATVQQENYDGRNFVIKRVSKVEELPDCQILFIARSEARRLDRIIAAVKDKPVLTVSDMDDAEEHGVQVRFVTVNNKIRLRIDLDALKRTGLMMSSQLLSLAQIVPEPGK